MTFFEVAFCHPAKFFFEHKMHIGEKIKMLRQLRGLTQVQLAAKIHKCRSVICNAECTGKLSYYNREAIAKAFNIPVQQLEEFDHKAIHKPENIEDHQLVIQLREKIAHQDETIEHLKKIVAIRDEQIAMYTRKR